MKRKLKVAHTVYNVLTMQAAAVAEDIFGARTSAMWLNKQAKATKAEPVFYIMPTKRFTETIAKVVPQAQATVEAPTVKALREDLQRLPHAEKAERLTQIAKLLEDIPVRRGPGRPAKNALPVRRGPGRPPGSKNKAAQHAMH